MFPLQEVMASEQGTEKSIEQEAYVGWEAKFEELSLCCYIAILLLLLLTVVVTKSKS